MDKKVIRPPKNGKTPSGGDYIEVYYFDEKGNSVSEKKAKKATIRELTNDGKLVCETTGFIGRG